MEQKKGFFSRLRDGLSKTRDNLFLRVFHSAEVVDDSFFEELEEAMILADMGMVVAEGVWTAKGAYALARKKQVETPIIDEIYRILYEDRDVADAIRALMTRSAKSE